MSDQTVITLVGMLVGFFTLWLKLKYDVREAKDAATKAATKAAVVEEKLDENTVTTKAVDAKADTIVEQTNGSMTALRGLIETTVERVSKLEEYNRSSAHRLLGAINAMHLKVAELVALQPRPTIQIPTTIPTTGEK